MGRGYFDLGDLCAVFNWLWKEPVGPFESEFAEYLGTRFALGTSFGRTALYVGLRAIDVKDREVIIPSFVCTVVRNAVVTAGATPRFVDVSPDDLTYDLHDLDRNITQKTKAVVVIHYFGQVAGNLEQVVSLARKRGIAVIEDCAHALGAEFEGKKVGTSGDFSVFSLTKGMINFGGGVLATNSEEIWSAAKGIVEGEHRSLKTRIADFPLIFEYGLEQGIDKLIFDRVGKSLFKWWLIKLPRFILWIRGKALALVKEIGSLNGSSGTSSRGGKASAVENKESVNATQVVSMEPIIASLARSQLRKIDWFLQRRTEILGRLRTMRGSVHEMPVVPDAGEAATFLILRFRNTDLLNVVDRCKRQGLLLRPTWPTHQRLWPGQDTDQVKKFEREFLTWNVNPMVTNKEIKRFDAILSLGRKPREPRGRSNGLV